jgi:hypothetical protein
MAMLLLCLIQFPSIRFANAATVLPADVKSTCTFSTGEFNAIFASGSASSNGAVLPANSFSFTPNSLCSFYKWSAQMFLWLTSPVPAQVGSHVFDSSVFFAVSPLDSNGRRNLVPNAPGQTLPFDCHRDVNGNMLGTPAFADGFTGGLSHIWAAMRSLLP